MCSLEGSGSPPCPAEASRFIQKPSWVQSRAPSRSPQPRFTSVKAVSLKGFWAGSVSGRYSPRIGRGEGAANHSGPAGGSTVIMSSWWFSSVRTQGRPTGERHATTPKKAGSLHAAWWASKQRASQGAGIPREGKHRSTKCWFNLGIFKIHRHLRLQGKPKGNSKILTV